MNPNVAFISNPNILHNGDFRNPVNQRGQTEYSGGAVTYAIDRWFVSGTTSQTLSVHPGFIRLTKLSTTTLGSIFGQHIENPQGLLGKTITTAVETSIGIFMQTVTLPSSMSDWNGPIMELGNSGFRMMPQINGNRLTLGRITSPGVVIPNDISIDIYRIKVELGTVSTLQNDPPMDFGKELAVCQRYQTIIGDVNSSTYRASRIRQNDMTFSIPLTTRLRIIPTIVAKQSPTPYLQIFNHSNVLQDGFTFSCFNPGNAVSVIAEKAGHGLTDGHLLMQNYLLDANL